MTIFSRVLLALFLVGSTTATLAANPSFDCKGSKTWVEADICSDDQLALLDSALSGLFKKTTAMQTNTGPSTATPAQQEQLSTQIRKFALKAQNAWLLERDRACRPLGNATTHASELECLRQIYRHRLDSLRSDAPGMGQNPLDVAQVLTPITTIRLGNALPGATRIVNGHVLFYRIASDQRGWAEFLANASNGAIEEIAQLPGEPRYLFADQTRVVLGEQKDAIVVAHPGTTQVKLHTAALPWKASVVGQNLLLLEGDKPLTYELFDLQTGQLQFSNATILAGEIVFWGDHVVQIGADGHITVFSEKLDVLASAQILDPSDVSVSRMTPPTLAATVLGDYLVMGLIRGATVVLNLKTMKAAPPIGPFDSWTDFHYALAGKLLFMLPSVQTWPYGNHLGSPPVYVYDIERREQITALHLVASDLSVSGSILTALTDSGDVSSFTIHTDVLESSDFPETALRSAYAKAKMIVSTTGSIYDAISQFQEVDTSVLAHADGLAPDLKAMALDHASWLSMSLIRHAEGLRQLRIMAAAEPHNPEIRQRLGGALLRDYVITSNPATLSEARGLLGEEHFPAREITERERLAALPLVRPINLGSFVYRLFPRDDKLFVWVGGGYYPTSISAFDRTTLDHLGTYQIRSPDNERAGDIIADVTYVSGDFTAWLGSEPAAVTVNMTTGAANESRIGGSTSFVISAKGAVIACSPPDSGWGGTFPSYHCKARDPQTLKGIAKFQLTVPFRVGDQNVTDPAVAEWILAKATTRDGSALMPIADPPLAVSLSLGMNLIAFSDAWAIRPVVSDVDLGVGGPHFLRLGTTTAKWRLANLPSLGFYPQMKISDPADTAILGDIQKRSKYFIGLDLLSNVSSTLLESEPSVYPAWTVADDLLLVATDHDLVIYDIKEHQVAGVLRGVTPAGHVDISGDASAIESVESDGVHVFLRTRQRLEQYDQVIDLKDLRAFAKLGALISKYSDETTLRH